MSEMVVAPSSARNRPSRSPTFATVSVASNPEPWSTASGTSKALTSKAGARAMASRSAGDRRQETGPCGVLQTTAGILRDTAREIDKLGRYGGEEFLAVLPDTDMDDGPVFADRVRRRLRRHHFRIGRRSPLRMTISAGVASYPAEDEVTDPATLLQRADRALYAAKTAGRDRVVRYGRDAGPDDAPERYTEPRT